MAHIGYNIKLKLYEDYLVYYDNDYDRLSCQVFDHFNWASDILYNTKKVDICNRVDKLLMDVVMTPEIVTNIRNTRKRRTDRELGEYAKKSGIDKSIVEALGFVVEDIIDSSFDVDTATISITTACTDKTADEIKEDIMTDSLEDGLYEECGDDENEGNRFDIYAKGKLNTTPIVNMLKRYKCLKNDERLLTTEMDFSVHCGTIDYRLSENVTVTEIRCE
jgi:hypothetical protein